MKPTVLIVDDEKNIRDGLRAALEYRYETFVAKDAAEAARLMQDVPPDAVLTDLRMAGEDGMAVIDRALKLPNQPVCIMMTAYGDVDTAVKAMSLGAYWFFQKPVDLRQVELVLDRGLKARTTEKEVVTLKARLDRKFSLGEIIGSSSALQRSIEQVRSVASSNATILLLGETGTGKELFAQMIHQASQRAKGPFMAVHCAAIPANLLESELFGHEKGAFTGANERRVGRFESADGGTLFLDEIGEIDATTQVKLLRFLETRSSPHRPRSSPRLRHESRPPANGQGGQVPRRSLLSLVGGAFTFAALARTSGRHPAPSFPLPRALRKGELGWGREAFAGSSSYLGPISLARQHP